MLSAEKVIERLCMQPLEEEGGYYVQTYVSDEAIPKIGLPERYPAARPLYSAILYLLTPHVCSAMHRLSTDDMFHFYLGDPVTMLQLRPDGSSAVLNLGHDILHGQKVQVVVPRDTWQGSFLNEGGRFALMGTTMAPGFDAADYELGSREPLIREHPEQRDLITRLTAGS